jgi:predicted enzyme related to lactoylglutathione lyase
MFRRSSLLLCLVSAALCVRAVAATPAVPFELPPLMQPAAPAHPGKVIWAELTTTDLAADKAFYSGLFGWNFHDLHIGNGDYAVALLGGAPIAGLVQLGPGSTKPQRAAWLTFISVRSVHATSRKIVTHGGRLLTPPRSYRQRGSQAVYADPQGAVFALLHSSSGDPPDVVPAPGEWIWSALLTREAEPEAAFYQNVFGYEVFELPEGGLPHLLLSTDNYARAVIDETPPETAALPHWIDFLRVQSAADAAAKAKALGGRVLVEPRHDRQGGLMAVLAGPDGAAFGVLEWSDSMRSEIAK